MWLKSGVHGGASDGNREDGRSSTFRGSMMSSCLDISNVSAHGMCRRGNSGGNVQQEAGNTDRNSGKLGLEMRICES